MTAPGLSLDHLRQRPLPGRAWTARSSKAIWRTRGSRRSAPQRARQGQTAAPIKEVFSRCAKAFLDVGGKGGPGYDRVLGLTLELVPEKDPTAPRPPAPGSCRCASSIAANRWPALLVTAFSARQAGRQGHGAHRRRGPGSAAARPTRELAGQGGAHDSGPGGSRSRLGELLGLPYVRDSETHRRICASLARLAPACRIGWITLSMDPRPTHEIDLMSDHEKDRRW